MESFAKRKYLHDTLKETGESILRKQTEVIEQWNLKKTGELEGRRRWRIIENDTGSADLEIGFVKYLRFLDMKKREGRKKARAYELYNKVLFGHLASLRRKLLFGFTREVKEKIVKEIKIEL